MSVDVRGLVFVGTRTRDAVAMSAFARDVLGLDLRSSGGGAGRDGGADRDGEGGDGEGGDGAAFFDLPDGSSFAVQPTAELEPAERTVGFLVDDLDVAVAELRAAGVATDEVAQGERQRYVHFRAPDGQLYELVQDG